VKQFEDQYEQSLILNALVFPLVFRIQNPKLMRIWCIFTPNQYSMSRQSISFTEPNDEWLKKQVESKEYTSKSELVNDLIRQARKQQRQIDWIRLRLETAEKSGFSDDEREDILRISNEGLSGKL